MPGAGKRYAAGSTRCSNPSSEGKSATPARGGQRRVFTKPAAIATAIKMPMIEMIQAGSMTRAPTRRDSRLHHAHQPPAASRYTLMAER
jgi:hypothetical protein